MVDQNDFKNSFVLLSQDKSEEFELSYKEILSMGSRNELTVLSACQTGIGQDIDGEGLMSLSRAFTFAGSKSTMGSYWDVPDRSTMLMMELFYSNLKKGMSKSSALKNAQVNYMIDDNITSPSIRAPYYWAGWAVYGNNTPIELESNLLQRLKDIAPFSILLLLFVVLALYRILRKRKS